jgi:hypothetical protein
MSLSAPTTSNIVAQLDALIVNWANKRRSADRVTRIHIAPRKSCHTDDWVYAAILHPTTLLEAHIEIGINAAQRVCIAFEKRRRVAERLGYATRDRACVAHLVIPVANAAQHMTPVLDCMVDGKIAARPFWSLSWPLLGVDCRALLLPDTYKGLRFASHQPLNLCWELAESFEAYAALCLYRPWTGLVSL